MDGLLVVGRMRHTHRESFRCELAETFQKDATMQQLLQDWRKHKTGHAECQIRGHGMVRQQACLCHSNYIANFQYQILQ